MSVAAVACGDDDSDDAAPSEDAAAASLAEAALLTLEDLPPGWTEEIEDAEDPIDACSSPPEGELAERETDTFLGPSELPALKHYVVVVELEEQARAVVANREPFVDCVVEQINEGELDEDEVEFREAGKAALDLASAGEASSAYRITTVAQEKLDDDEADVFIDILYVASGRLASALIVSNVLSPTDEGFLERLMDAATLKMEAAQSP